ncbi:BUD13 homolog isoform X1 [Ostrea edulis]|uniref:BUD13 homolog isoform X1 n=1 Tax=Ostrea edulis TaxID=37623 RepID=UPI0024AEEE28|nr:BUD13 homolog isoform X1 [Ostrea edulis]
MYLGRDHRPSKSKLGNFLTYQRERDSNPRRQRSRIVDDDVDLKSLPSNLDDVTAYDNIEENVPTVAAVFDERPKHIQELEAYKTDKWKRMKANNGDSSPRMRHDSDSDCSPPLKKRHDSDSDQSPLRRTRHDSDQSPLRRTRHDSDSDPSPPRKGRHNPDQSPQRKRHNSDSDQSIDTRQDSDSDPSPRRKGKHDTDSDHSPPRRGQRENSAKMNKTLSGKRAGLSSAKDMKREADILKKREDETFKQIDADLLGKNVKTQYRKSGRQQKIKDKEPTAEDLKRREELEAKYSEWGKGLKQTEDKAARVEDHLYEMSKPLSRAKDDEDLDAMLKNKERADDPMLAFIKKKTKDKAKKELPQYKGPPPPPNRFGIMPGYRWDGVDRSNGFERSIYAKLSDKKAVADMAYKWSVEDM